MRIASMATSLEKQEEEKIKCNWISSREVVRGTILVV